MDCTSKVMKVVHDSAFSCARTKTEAIVENVFAKLAMKNLKCDLNEASFISMCCDASNHDPIQLFQCKLGISLKSKVLCEGFKGGKFTM